MTKKFLIMILFSGLVVFPFAPRAAGSTKEDWARFTLGKGLKPGQTLTMEEWNALLDNLASWSRGKSKSVGAPSTTEGFWEDFLKIQGLKSKGTYTKEEWKDFLARSSAKSVVFEKEAAPPPPSSSLPSVAVSSASKPSPAPDPSFAASLMKPEAPAPAPPKTSSETVKETAPVPAPEAALSSAAVPVPMTIAAAPVPVPLLPPPAAPLVPEKTENPSPPPAEAKSKPSPLKKVSLDLRDMDVVEVLKILSRQSGLNIVVGKNVSGRVTVFLSDVEFWEALRTILETRDLAYAQEGSVVKVVTAPDYEKIYGSPFGGKTRVKSFKFKNIKASTAKALLDPFKSKVGNLVVNEPANTLMVEETSEKMDALETLAVEADKPAETRIFNLSYGSVDDIVPKISPLVSKDYGSIQYDKRSNAIVVTDNPARLIEISKMVETFDSRSKAVLIEAKIIQIVLNDENQWGVNWQRAFSEIGRAPFDNGTLLSGRVVQNLQLSPAEALKSPNITASGITASVSTVRGLEYSGVINFLKTVGTTNMLSAPRIVAMNNVESHILVGTEQPIITKNIINPGSTTNSPIVTEDVKTKEVGVKLYVTPVIGSDGFMTLKIKPEVSAIESIITTSNGSSIPIVTTSNAETNVVVKDGTTVVIGGLIEDKRIKTDKRVPLLGDLPLVGMFFRSRDNTVKKTELVIFLTPHLMSGEAEAPEAEAYLPRWKSDFDKGPAKRGIFRRLFGRNN